jgi:alcohol dehydrogenase class IV
MTHKKGNLMNPSYSHNFRAQGFPWRLYSGTNALDNLPAELKRNKARRAFVVSGRTVSRKTDLVNRIEAILGENYAGRFDEIDKDTTLDSVTRAAAAAKAAGADLLIGVGAGSVMQGVRVVAILMAENRPVEELITQYPENGPAISARLMERKVPIINVLTAATSAQNRAGSAVKDPNRNHRMEFFDPKTRPVALFWDNDALMTAPLSLVRTTSLSSFWRSTMNLGIPSINPLAEGDRLQAYRLARFALERVTGPAHATDVTPRIASCAATFLQNRDADDGSGNAGKHWVSRVVYAFATATFQLHEHVGQGEANCALTPHVMRKLGARDPEAMALIAQGLGVWVEADGMASAPEKAAAEIERVLQQAGAPMRVSALGIPRESLATILNNSMRNFNADPKREFIREKDFLGEVLQSCW